MSKHLGWPRARTLIALCGLATVALSGPSSAQSSQGTRLFDELVAQVGSRVPGFGGMFITYEGGAKTLSVYVLRPSERTTSEIERAVTEVLGHEYIPTGGIRLRQGKYEFLELKRLYDRSMSRVLGVPGVVFTEINQGSNRLRVGVESAAVGTQVQSMLTGLGVPLESVELEMSKPYAPDELLTDSVRPTLGGLQIAFDGGYLCTLGFNARLVNEQRTPGFLTNSHCSRLQGTLDGTTYFQSKMTSVDLIGTKKIDPPYGSLGFLCPAGFGCRFSDSAFARYASPLSTLEPGWIAATCTGMTEICLFTHYRITKVQFSLFGDVVRKVGRTTGTTDGVVVSTCSDVPQKGTKFVILCQTRVNGATGTYSGKGDSGSPVFRIDRAYDEFTVDVAALGIHWGGGGGAGVFSPLPLVLAELGSMSVCATGFSC